jgi:hypothetical protein
MPFRHPDRAHDLGTRIELEIRERLEEAIDHVCLQALVRARRASGLEPPAADNPADRRAWAANVAAFLQRLAREVTAGPSPEERGETSRPAVPNQEPARLLAAQVALARLLPDYWQRFEAVSARYLAEPDATSRREGGLLARLFGRR